MRIEPTIPHLRVYRNSIRVGCDVSVNDLVDTVWWRVIAIDDNMLTVIDGGWDVPNQAHQFMHLAGVRQVRGGVFDYPAIHESTLATRGSFLAYSRKTLAQNQARIDQAASNVRMPLVEVVVTGATRAIENGTRMVETILDEDTYFPA